MPFIHIKSLPFEQPFASNEVLTHITQSFAQQNNLPLEHVHASWEFFKPGHFAKGNEAPDFQSAPHSVLVALLTPDFNDKQTCERMLTTLADILSTQANIPVNKIFIHHRLAKSGMVFDDGQIVHW